MLVYITGSKQYVNDPINLAIVIGKDIFTNSIAHAGSSFSFAINQ